MARDGTVAALIVGDDGQLLEFTAVGRQRATGKYSRRWIAPSLRVLRERAEQRRTEAAIRGLLC